MFRKLIPALFILFVISFASCGSNDKNNFKEFLDTLLDADGNIVGYVMNPTFPNLAVINDNGAVMYINYENGQLKPPLVGNSSTTDAVLDYAYVYAYESTDCSGTPYLDATRTSDPSLYNRVREKIYVAGVGPYDGKIQYYSPTDEFKKINVCSQYDVVSKSCVKVDPCDTDRYTTPYITVSDEEKEQLGLKTNYGPLHIKKENMIKLYDASTNHIAYMFRNLSRLPIITVLSTNEEGTEYISKIQSQSGYMDITDIYYTSTDCTGTPYMRFGNGAYYQVNDNTYKQYYSPNLYKRYVVSTPDLKLYIAEGTPEVKDIQSRLESTGKCKTTSQKYVVIPFKEISETDSHFKSKYDAPLMFEAP